jgi:thiamine biosynthesis lipoprotein
MASPCQVLSKADRATAQMQLELAATEAWRVEAKYSRYLDGNIVHRINSADGAAVETDEETANLIDFAATLYELSDRRFDITSGVLREVWRFDGSDRVPRRAEVSRVLQRVGWHQAVWRRPVLTLAPGMQIDFGGIGKEYAVDRAAALVAAQSGAPCLINFGGDIAAVGAAADDEPWRVGIESLSAGAATPFKRIELHRGGLATSGDARRFLLKDGVRYGHVLNPLTGWPVVNAPRSVTVAADTCTQAGMLSTFAMLMGESAEIFLQQQSVRFWCIRRDTVLPTTC